MSVARSLPPRATLFDLLLIAGERRLGLRYAVQRWARADEVNRKSIGAHRDARAGVAYAPAESSIGRYVASADVRERDSAAAITALEGLCLALLEEVL